MNNQHEMVEDVVASCIDQKENVSFEEISVSVNR